MTLSIYTIQCHNVARTTVFEKEILDNIEQGPSTSVSAIAQHMESTKLAVWRFRHDQLIPLYHIQRVLAMGSVDYHPRLAFFPLFLGCQLVQQDFRKRVTQNISFQLSTKYTTQNWIGVL